MTGILRGKPLSEEVIRDRKQLATRFLAAFLTKIRSFERRPMQRPANSGSWLRSGLLLPIAALLLVSGIQVLSSPPWIFTPDGNDQWIYHGYFLHLKHHIAAFDGLYYGTRLAWILPGYVVHSLFPLLVANIVLRLLLYWTAVISVFFFITRSYEVRCGLISSLLLCAAPDFLSAIGWDYVDGAGIACALLGFEELGAAIARQSFPRAAVFRAGMAGVAFAGAVHSNIFLLVLAAPILLFLVGRAGRRALPLAIYTLLGSLLLTTGLGFCSLALGGQFLFFMPSLNAGAGIMKANPVYLDPSIWISQAWWLVIPSAIFVATLAAIPRWMITTGDSWSNNSGRFVDTGCVLVMSFVLVGMTVLKSPVLQLPFYASYLVIFIPFGVGAMLARQLDSWDTRGFAALGGSCGLLALLVGTNAASWLPAPFIHVYKSIETWPSLSPAIFAGALCAVILAAAYLPLRSIAKVAIILVVGIVVLHVGHIRLRESAGGEVSRDLYLDVDRASRELARLSADKPLWFWYSYAPEKDQHYTSVAFTYLWAYRLLGRNLPDVSDLRFDAIKRGAYLAIMESDESVLAQAMTALQAHGLALEPITRRISVVGRNRYIISLVQVTGVDVAPKVYNQPPDRLTLKTGAEVLNYDLAALVAHCEHAFYGKPISTPESTPPGIFRITDSRDHFATTFQALIDFGPISAVEITVTDQSAGKEYGPVNMLCQDQDYRTLYSSGTLGAGHARTLVGLPAGTRAIRIVFLANDEGYVRFPQHVQLEGFQRAAN